MGVKNSKLKGYKAPEEHKATHVAGTDLISGFLIKAFTNHRNVFNDYRSKSICYFKFKKYL